jgi:methylthioribose-1-phosphate isomerase
MIRTVEWNDGKVRLIDQTRLPGETVFLDLETPDQVAEAIKTMKIRGAPAIGVAAAMGIAVAAWNAREGDHEAMKKAVDLADDVLRSSRPTARNLFWALDRMRNAWSSCGDRESPPKRAERMVVEAERILKEDIEISERIGRHGAAFLPSGGAALTHCNAGGLATGGGGTALAVIRHAYKLGKIDQVYADETRPLLQGARLTAWELKNEGIPVRVISDSSAAWTIKTKGVRTVVVGADRIAANGDVANKIGTYSVALAAREHGALFIVAAPTTTLDPGTPTGDSIPIEERAPEEVTTIGDRRWAPKGVEAFNPAFDVTPASLVSAIVTEMGVMKPPYDGQIERAVREAAGIFALDKGRDSV